MDRTRDITKIYNRYYKVRKRPHYNKNHKIKKRKQKGPVRLAGYKTWQRRMHRTVHPGWKKVTKEFNVSPDLQAVIGRSMCSRGQIVRLIWRYIKDHKLQKQGNGRIFIPDQALARVVGNEGQELDGFKMMAYLNAHIL